MKRISFWNVLVVFVMVFMVGCGGKTTSIEGKIVDGKGKPLEKVKVVAKMSQPIKGYEQFETATGSDGAFTFNKLFPTSEYQLIFYSDRWTKEKKMKTDSGPEGQTKMLPDSVMIRYMDIKEGIILDTKTNLMWPKKDNGQGVNWANAKSYCENYRGGGYTDWRMPTEAELVSLYDKSIKRRNKNNIIEYYLTELIDVGEGNHAFWTIKTNGAQAALVCFAEGQTQWGQQQHNGMWNQQYRILPVRSGT